MDELEHIIFSTAIRGDQQDEAIDNLWVRYDHAMTYLDCEEHQEALYHSLNILLYGRAIAAHISRDITGAIMRDEFDGECQRRLRELERVMTRSRYLIDQSIENMIEQGQFPNHYVETLFAYNDGFTELQQAITPLLYCLGDHPE